MATLEFGDIEAAREALAGTSVRRGLFTASVPCDGCGNRFLMRWPAQVEDELHAWEGPDGLVAYCGACERSGMRCGTCGYAAEMFVRALWIDREEHIAVVCDPCGRALQRKLEYLEHPPILEPWAYRVATTWALTKRATGN